MNLFNRQMAKTIQYVNIVEPESVSELRDRVLIQMKNDFGMYGVVPPPLTLHSPAPEILAGLWTAFRETMLVGNIGRAYKESISTAISRINKCPYCVDAHSMTLHALSQHEAADAICSENKKQIKDPELYLLVKWALSTRSPGSKNLLPPPFSRENAPEVIGLTLVFHFLNRMVNVFLDDFIPIPSRFGLIKQAAMRVGSLMMKDVVKRSLEPGESLRFIPEAALPDDLSWMASNQRVGSALGKFAAVVEKAGRATLSEEVRTIVKERVQAWNGEDFGISRQWIGDAISGVSEENKSAAQLTLLTALASHQVDAGVIEAFRRRHPGDDKLIEATAWASFTVARRIGLWLNPTQ